MSFRATHYPILPNPCLRATVVDEVENGLPRQRKGPIDTADGSSKSLFFVACNSHVRR